VNHLIRISPIRLIGPDNEQVGVVETSEAMRKAQEHGLDLVEVVPDARPPVCKIMDYGKFKYEQSKKQKKGSGASKATELKEVRLGRSVKIDPHDIGIRIDQARRFILAGHKVLVIQRFRGREIAHKELGLEHLDQVVKALEDVAKVEQAPRFMGRAASIVLAPDRVKIEAIKRKEAKDKAEAEGPAEPEGAKGESEKAQDQDQTEGRGEGQTEGQTEGSEADAVPSRAAQGE
jgi:translation initiation factor IF-3